MDYFEITHESEDTTFYRSLRDCNVPTDLTIEGKDGCVFVHRAVLKSYSPLIDKRTKIVVEDAHVEDLSTLVRFYYDGQCVILRERLDSLLELSKKMEFKTLQAKLENAIESQNGDGETSLGRREETREEKQVPKQKYVALQQAIEIIMSQEGEEKETDSSHVQRSSQTQQDEEDGNTSSFFEAEQYMNERLHSTPVALSSDEKRLKNNTNRRTSSVSAYRRRKRTHNYWTTKQNQLFIHLWLQQLQNPDSDVNARMVKEMAKTGIFLNSSSISCRKHMFRRWYQKQSMGQNQPYIKDYLPQLKKIYEMESCNGSNEDSSNYKEEKDEAEMVYDEPRYVVDYNETETQDDLSLALVDEGNDFDTFEDTGDENWIVQRQFFSSQSDNFSDVDDNFSRETLDSDINSTRASPSKRPTKYLDVGRPVRKSSALEVSFSKDMLILLLEVWLKNINQDFKKVVAPMIVDALGEINCETTIERVINKKHNIMRNYREYQEGKNHPGILPYLPLLDKIKARLHK